MEASEPYRGLIAEGKGDSLLQVASSRHRRIAILSGETGQRFDHCFKVLFYEQESGADLEDGSRVGDVLRCCAPVAPLPESVLTKRSQLLHDRQDGITDVLRRRLQSLEIHFGNVAVPSDFFGRLRWNDTQTCLHHRQRFLDV